jgi:hypothetical protein
MEKEITTRRSQERRTEDQATDHTDDTDVSGTRDRPSGEAGLCLSVSVVSVTLR